MDILSHKNDDQKEFFKGIVAGIVEAKVELDNGKDEIILNGNNFNSVGKFLYERFPKRNSVAVSEILEIRLR